MGYASEEAFATDLILARVYFLISCLSQALCSHRVGNAVHWDPAQVSRLSADVLSLDSGEHHRLSLSAEGEFSCRQHQLC